MPLTAFDHVNIRTRHLDAMIAWYGDILDLHAGDRPDFPFPGAWLYLGDTAVVHLIAVTEATAPGPTLTLEHFAFRAQGHAAFVTKLKDKGVPFRESRVPDGSITQVNIHDPDGNHIHVDFRSDEAD